MFLEEGSDNESIATDSTVEEDLDSDHEFAIEQILAEVIEEGGKYLSENRSVLLVDELTDRFDFYHSQMGGISTPPS